MPKVLTYARGSIIFFEGDKDERIYILQSGTVILSQSDLETGAHINEQVNPGEFFGVKSALAHKPKMETANVLTDVQVIQLSVQEFEQIIGKNQDMILKMLRAFSKSLRQIHKKTENVLKNDTAALPPELGMNIVAQCFFDEQKYVSCMSICNKLLSRYPTASNAAGMKKLLSQANLLQQRVGASKRGVQASAAAAAPADTALKQFELPMFERFSKTYEDGEVIISEFEPGDCFYLIQSGHVQLEKCIKGAMKNLDILRPGEFFGEMAILDNSPRSATCIAKGPVKCLEFNKENFKALITGNPQIAIILLKLFCKRIYAQKRRFRILCIEDLQARLADVFLMYDDIQVMEDKVPPTGSKRKFQLTINDVAHWAGIALDVAKDELSKYSAKKRIEIYDDYIIVLNIQEMKRTVDAYFSTHDKSKVRT
ncbi:MAG: cyclic nucleotide-binding domain-containing protein [Treponema sp.]|nr:cyclic nucleotide-binding domain-containing protein [Treponema sp.]MBQ2551250.1 cyclic nucleotide-binding domain-containing protein [Treponema sp.]MBQ5383724.1 cyclic nucleotide-binding domain-containing protein [Treponema sp.]